MKLLTEYQKIKQIKGIEKDWPTKPEFLPFEEAKKIIRSLDLQNLQEWKKYCKSGNKPNNIPAAPWRNYKETGWIGLGDWLGTGRIAGRDLKFRSFEEARNFAQSLNLKSESEWREYCKSERKPNDIPRTPEQVYKNNGWISMGDWLGTGYIASQNRKYLSFAEARNYVQSLQLKSANDWSKYCKSGSKPDNIPATPTRTYKNDWTNWGDWLGTGNVCYKTNIFLSFEKAREFARSLKFKSSTEWKKYCKSDKRPKDIPCAPDQCYRDSGWVSWGDWLGTGRIAHKDRTYLPFKEARKFVRSLKIKRQKEWFEYCKTGRIPDSIPTNPNIIYKDSGWNQYKDWLGT